MNQEELNDLLVEGLLPEALGVEKPPDVSARVLFKVQQQRRYRFWRRCAAAAVLAAAAAVLWHAAALRKHEPTAQNAETVGVFFAFGALPRPVQRGEYIAAPGEARLEYAGSSISVKFYPGAAAFIAGDSAGERLRLMRGAIHCRVDPENQRPFVVETEFGTASVKGTEFSVQVLEDENGRKESGMFKRMVVCVFAGVVAVTAAAPAEDTVAVNAGAGAVVTVTDGVTTVMEIGDTALLSTSVAGTAVGGNIFVRFPGDEDTQRQFNGLRIREKMLQEKQLAIEMKTSEAPAVAQAAKTMDETIAAFRQALMANKDYAALVQERDNLEKEQRNFWTAKREDGIAPQERHKQWIALFQRLQELNMKISSFADNVPELAALKKKQAEAIAGFANALQQALAANAEYMALVKQIDLVRDAMKDLQAKYTTAIQRRVHLGEQPGANREPKEGGVGEAPAQPGKETAVF